ncbi:MAG: hypothetical protein JXQ72_16990, partial [Anaerolineae bacterium]|nr:hypothetical protein [Anaerolineae bacterium]
PGNDLWALAPSASLDTLAAGAHTITMTHAGDLPPYGASVGFRIGLCVKPVTPTAPTTGCYEEVNPAWVIAGEWHPQYRDDASMGALISYDGTLAGPDAYLEFTFQADGASLVYRKGPDGGIAAIYLDGALYAELDTYAPSDQVLGEAVFTVNGLDPAVEHTLRIVPTGRKNTRSSGYLVDIDRLDVPAYNAQYNNNCLFTRPTQP